MLCWYTYLWTRSEKSYLEEEMLCGSECQQVEASCLELDERVALVLDDWTLAAVLPINDMIASNACASLMDGDLSERAKIPGGRFNCS